MMKKPFALIAFFSLLVVLLSLPPVFDAQTVKTKSSRTSTRIEQTVNTDDNTWNWHRVDNGIDLHVTIRGKVEFADDYSAVTAISPGNGDVRITHRRGGVTRKFEATGNGRGAQTGGVRGRRRREEGRRRRARD